jgi:hypothetical protein
MKKVIKLLTALGDSSNDVAANLKRMRITGTPGEPCDCPIAKYLIKHGCNDVFVRSCQLNYRFKNHVSGEIDLYFSHRAIHDFVYEFDKGDYPYLETYIHDSF